MAGYHGGFGGGFGGANLNALMRQAQKLQEDMQKQKEQLETEFSSNIGGGQVELVMYGSKKVKSLKINPQIVDPDDVEMLEDMIVAAYSDCLSQIEKVEAENMPNMPMGF